LWYTKVMPAADQAQATAEGALHQTAVAASQALNKLARALQQVGADDATVKQVDDAANMANDLASSAVGNPPSPPANPGSDPNLSPQDALGSAVQDFHNQAVAGAAQGA
jgi:hypothetical protein